MYHNESVSTVPIDSYIKSQLAQIQRNQFYIYRMPVTINSNLCGLKPIELMQDEAESIPERELFSQTDLKKHLEHVDKICCCKYNIMLIKDGTVKENLIEK